MKHMSSCYSLQGDYISSASRRIASAIHIERCLKLAYFSSWCIWSQISVSALRRKFDWCTKPGTGENTPYMMCLWMVEGVISQCGQGVKLIQMARDALRFRISLVFSPTLQVPGWGTRQSEIFRGTGQFWLTRKAQRCCSSFSMMARKEVTTETEAWADAAFEAVYEASAVSPLIRYCSAMPSDMMRFPAERDSSAQSRSGNLLQICALGDWYSPG